MPAEFHWGHWVDSDTPTTGVFSNNSLEYIGEEADSGEDPDWIGLEEAFEADPEEARRYYCLPDEWETWEDVCDHSDWSQTTSFVGMVRGEDGKWDNDPSAEWSGIVSFDGMNITQVTRSQWVIRGELGSPCIPGQVDADTPGEFLAYAVPPSVVGDCDPELRARIEPLPGTAAWDSVVAEYDRAAQEPTNG